MKIAARMLAKRPGFTLVIVLTLALGIGANTMIFSVVNAYLIRPLPFSDAGRLVAVSDVQPQNVLTPASWPEFQRWRDGNQVFDGVFATFTQNRSLTGRRDPARVRVSLVSRGTFDQLGIKPVAGRSLAPDEHKPGAAPVAAISIELWQREFGGASNAIGQPLTLDHTAYTVVGVFDAAPLRFGSGLPVDVWIPLERDPPYTAEGVHFLSVMAKRKHGISLDQAQANLKLLGKQLDEKYKTGHGISAQPLRESLFGDVRPSLLMLLGAAGFLLLIATANVGNILLARASSRSKEFAIRAALGAGRWQLMQQALSESLLLAAAGGILGMLLSMWGTGLLRTILPRSLARPEAFYVDWRVLLFLAATSMLCGILFGLAPAVQSSAQSFNESLKRGGTRSRVRNALVVSEIAIASVLLAGAGLLLQSFWRVMQVDPGFHAENVLTFSVSLPSAKYTDDQKQIAFFDNLTGRIRSLPGVLVAGAVDNVPMGDGEINGDFRIAGRPPFPPDQTPITEKYTATPDYFRAMGMRLLRGRWFTEQDGQTGREVVIINESFARKYWSNEDPIGKRMDIAFGRTPGWQEIVGVVGDVRLAGLDKAAVLEAYVPYRQVPYDQMTFAIRTTGDPEQLASAVRTQMLAVDREQPIYNVRTMQQVVSDSLAGRRLSTLLLATFAALAMLLAGIGIYGVVSYWVSQRTREIGIRTALGAGRRDILRLVLSRGMLLVGIGVAVGSVASLILTRFLANLLFGVSFHDAFTMAAVPLTLGLIALAACYIPARRAARVDPLIALRFE